MLIFLVEFGAERYVDHKYGLSHSHNIENAITNDPQSGSHLLSHQQLHSGDQDQNLQNAITEAKDKNKPLTLTHAVEIPQVVKQEPSQETSETSNSLDVESLAAEHSVDRSFGTQIAAFLILEAGVIFHSVIIGLNLGTVGDEFKTLFPVLVFHQSFEGLGIGARMSAIAFPKRWANLPWYLCAAYGLTTPVAIAIGLALRTTYNSGSYTANVVSGVLDSMSAGILIYTGLVELLARDFLFNSELTKDSKRLAFMIGCVFLGTLLMALLGKWA